MLGSSPQSGKGTFCMFDDMGCSFNHNPGSASHKGNTLPGLFSVCNQCFVRASNYFLSFCKVLGQQTITSAQHLKISSEKFQMSSLYDTSNQALFRKIFSGFCSMAKYIFPFLNHWNAQETCLLIANRMGMSVATQSCPPHTLELWTQDSGRSHGQSKHVSVLLLPALGLWYSHISPTWMNTEVEIPELHHSWCKSHWLTKISPSGALLLGKVFPETKLGYSDILSYPYLSYYSNIFKIH